MPVHERWCATCDCSRQPRIESPRRNYSVGPPDCCQCYCYWHCYVTCELNYWLIDTRVLFDDWLIDSVCDIDTSTCPVWKSSKQNIDCCCCLYEIFWRNGQELLGLILIWMFYSHTCVRHNRYIPDCVAYFRLLLGCTRIDRAVKGQVISQWWNSSYYENIRVHTWLRWRGEL